MLKFILSVLALCWNLVWDLLALYWHWVVNNPARGLLVSGMVAVVFGIVSEVTGRKAKRPILGTYKTGRKEVVEEFGSKYIQDEIRVVEGKTTFGKRLLGCTGWLFAVLTYTAGFFAVVALIKLIF